MPEHLNKPRQASLAHMTCLANTAKLILAELYNFQDYYIWLPNMMYP